MSDNVKVSRPDGAFETDFSEVSDWTVTELATSPDLSLLDRLNANCELDKRKNSGNYKPVYAPQETIIDLATHGYELDDDGVIHYPTKIYSDWLNSDRSTPEPDGEHRMTLSERKIVLLQEKTQIKEAKHSKKDDDWSDKEAFLVEAVEYVKEKLSEKNALKKYFVEGAIDRISKGDFSLSNDFVAIGFRNLEGKKISELSGFREYEVWKEVNSHNIFPVVSSLEEMAKLEHEAIIKAISVGVVCVKSGFTDLGEFRFSLPVKGKASSFSKSETNNTDLLEFLNRFGFNLSDLKNEKNTKLRDAVFSGFFNLNSFFSNEIKEKNVYFENLKFYYGVLLDSYSQDEIFNYINKHYSKLISDDFRAKLISFVNLYNMVK